MERVFQIGSAAIVGLVLLAKTGLLAPALDMFKSEPEPSQLSSTDPWPKHYDPEQAAIGNVYYKNCDAARRAGAAPIHYGEPGYRAPLDRDGDGIACEPYRGR